MVFYPNLLSRQHIFALLNPWIHVFLKIENKVLKWWRVYKYSVSCLQLKKSTSVLKRAEKGILSTQVKLLINNSYKVNRYIICVRFVKEFHGLLWKVLLRNLNNKLMKNYPEIGRRSYFTEIYTNKLSRVI